MRTPLLISGRVASASCCCRVIDRQDGVRLLWSLLRSPNPEVSNDTAWVLCVKTLTYMYEVIVLECIASKELLRTCIMYMYMYIQWNLRVKDTSVLYSECPLILRRFHCYSTMLVSIHV